MTPTKEQVELYIKSADLELGPSSEDAWVEWCRDALRKALQPEEGPMKLLKDLRYELSRLMAGAPVDNHRIVRLVERINEEPCCKVPSPLPQRSEP